jgi:hypothetical protein
MFGRKKISPIERRLKELEHEVSMVSSDIKSLSRREKSGSLGAPSLTARSTESAPKTKPPAQSIPHEAAGDEFLSQTANEPASSVPADSTLENDMPLFEDRAPLSPASREKFANYFMAGHFQNLRPLKLEKRIIRNKAIIMIVAAVLALIWLIFWLNSQ